MERDPRLAQRVREVVRARVGRELITPRGDLVTEEIDEAEAGRRTADAVLNRH